MSERKHSMKALVGSTSTLVIGIVIGIAIDRAVVIHGHNSPHTPAVAVIASSGTDAAFRDLSRCQMEALGWAPAGPLRRTPRPARCAFGT